jgi:hypothetical protein
MHTQQWQRQCNRTRQPSRGSAAMADTVVALVKPIVACHRGACVHSAGLAGPRSPQSRPYISSLEAEFGRAILTPPYVGANDSYQRERPSHKLETWESWLQAFVLNC